MINKIALGIIAAMFFMLGKVAAGNECMKNGQFEAAGSSYRCQPK